MFFRHPAINAPQPLTEIPKRPYKILLGVPSAGSISEGSAQASFLASLNHRVDRLPSCLSGPNFNACWVQALNAGKQGLYTHFGMIHADLTVIEDEPGLRWIDRMLEEMDKVKADFISTPMAIKDIRLLTSTGIGNPHNRWNPWKRFTVKELNSLPMTFSAEDIGYGDKFLLHNHALCIWDLRKPIWYVKDDHGANRFVFNFTEDIREVNGIWRRFVDSEDWAFSRQLWQAGARTFVTKRIKTNHAGGMEYPNYGGGGMWDSDDDTAQQWNATPHEPIVTELADVAA